MCFRCFLLNSFIEASSANNKCCELGWTADIRSGNHSGWVIHPLSDSPIQCQTFSAFHASSSNASPVVQVECSDSSSKQGLVSMGAILQQQMSVVPSCENCLPHVPAAKLFLLGWGRWRQKKHYITLCRTNSASAQLCNSPDPCLSLAYGEPLFDRDAATRAVSTIAVADPSGLPGFQPEHPHAQ